MLKSLIPRKKRTREEETEPITENFDIQYQGQPSAALARSYWQQFDGTEQTVLLEEIVLRGSRSSCGVGQQHFLRAICLPYGDLPSAISLCTRKANLSFEKVEKEGNEKFDRIIAWLLRKDGEGGAEKPSSSALRHLESMGYITNEISSHKVTGSGIRFCLATRPQQVELVMVHACTNAIASDTTSAIKFLFLLLQHEVSKLYTFSSTLPGEQALLNVLAAFGVIYKGAGKDDAMFYAVHPIVKQLTLQQQQHISQPPSLGTSSTTSMLSSNLHVIVETNFRVYGFSSSSSAAFYARVLSQFVDVGAEVTAAGCAIPQTLIVCTLTYASATKAFRQGVSAQDVVSFLTQHIHPKAKKSHGGNGVPVTVIEQLFLWEEEIRRVSVVVLGPSFSSSSSSGRMAAKNVVIKKTFSTVMEKQHYEQSVRMSGQRVILGEMSPLVLIVAERS